MVKPLSPKYRSVKPINVPAFVGAPEDAPGNVAVGSARPGIPSSFMGKAGDDTFEYFPASTLAVTEVDVGPPRFSQRRTPC